ncbi:DUF6538 domain-containing protein [Bradyrhizobium barranii]|uniref:DUF6538 domain-containing protein n=1 Tax=Bradyrhizobium TaxID=374 RepID=UPI003F20EB15
MVHAFGTPKRNPQSGVFFLRKRVPDRLRNAVGKREIKISLRTRDPDVARIRHLECHSACNIDPLSRGIGVQNWL